MYSTENGRERLAQCFQGIFPSLDSEAVVRATHTDVPAWDSMASWMLLMAIQDEFSITIGLDQIPKLNSFSAIEAYLVRKLG